MMTRLLSGASGPRTRLKVCCIASIAEAELALRVGANALGLVSAMPSGPGVIPDARIAEVAAWVGDKAATVLLTSRQTAATIAEQLTELRPSVLQLVDEIAPDEMARLRERFPEIALMPVIHVTDERSVKQAIAAAAHADAILLDSGNPSLAVKELGGTGRVHDWAVSRKIRDAVGVPVFLAGGLNAGNVAQAIDAVRPFGVDVCSGVRRAGALDVSALAAFAAAVTA